MYALGSAGAAFVAPCCAALLLSLVLHLGLLVILLTLYRDLLLLLFLLLLWALACWLEDMLLLWALGSPVPPIGGVLVSPSVI